MTTYTYTSGEPEAADGFEAMSDACIANHEAIVKWGSPEMQTASQMLLYALAAEILRRDQAATPANDDEV